MRDVIGQDNLTAHVEIELELNCADGAKKIRGRINQGRENSPRIKSEPARVTAQPRAIYVRRLVDEP